MRRKRGGPRVCDDCRRPFGDELYLGPMLFDSVWSRLVEKPSMMLCEPCMSARASARLGRFLHLDDLTLCALNFHEGHFEAYLLRAAKAEPGRVAYSYLVGKLCRASAELPRLSFRYEQDLKASKEIAA